MGYSGSRNMALVHLGETIFVPNDDQLVAPADKAFFEI